MSDSEEIKDPNYRKKVKRKRDLNDSYENENLKKRNFEEELSNEHKEKNETENVSEINKEKWNKSNIPNEEKNNKDDILINHDINVKDKKEEDDLEKDAAKTREALTNDKEILGTPNQIPETTESTSNSNLLSLMAAGEDATCEKNKSEADLLYDIIGPEYESSKSVESNYSSNDFNFDSFSENPDKKAKMADKVAPLDAEEVKRRKEDLVKRFSALEDFKKSMEQKVNADNAYFVKNSVEIETLKRKNIEKGHQNTVLEGKLSEMSIKVNELIREKGGLEDK